jgi:cadherin EGF LAG seven-pass G-type receptor 1
MSQLLPDSFDYITVRNRETFPTRANSPVFLTVLRAANSSESIEKILPKVSYRFRILSSRGHSNPRCAYWAFDSKKSPTGRTKGKWSAKGCEIKAVYPTNRLISTFEYVNCTCDKIAPVAVLMDVTGPQALFQENAEQSLISYLGLTFATTVLLVALFILTVIMGRSTNSNDIHRNIVLCLLMTNVLFLVALKFKDELMQMEFPCKMVAILLHFFHVCVFSWMLVEGIHLQRMITEIRDINHGPMKFYYFIGYAVPAVIVGLSAGVKADLYGNYFL